MTTTRGDALQQLVVLHEVHRVGVHHDEQGPVRHRLQGLLGPDEHVLLRVGSGHGVHQGTGQGLVPVDDHRRGLLQPLADGGPHAHRGAHAVQVGVLVAHDEHPVAVLHVVGEGGGDDPGAHLVPLLHALGKAAEEFVGVTLLHDSHLVAAPAQGHIQGLAGPALALGDVAGAPAQPHRDGGAHVVFAAFYSPHVVQHPEAPLLGLLHVGLVGEEQVPVVAEAAEKAAHLLAGPAVEHRVHLAGDAGALAPHVVPQQLLPVVEHHQAHHGLFLPVLLVDGLEVGVVHKVEKVPLLGPGAVHGVLPAPVGHGRALFPHHLPEGFGVDVPQHVLPHKITATAQGIGKGLVGPHDVPRPAHHGHGQAEFLQGIGFLPGEHPLGPPQRAGGVPPAQQVGGAHRQQGDPPPR